LKINVADARDPQGVAAAALGLEVEREGCPRAGEGDEEGRRQQLAPSSLLTRPLPSWTWTGASPRLAEPGWLNILQRVGRGCAGSATSLP